MIMADVKRMHGRLTIKLAILQKVSELQNHQRKESRSEMRFVRIVNVFELITGRLYRPLNERRKFKTKRFLSGICEL